MAQSVFDRSPAGRQRTLGYRLRTLINRLRQRCFVVLIRAMAGDVVGDRRIDIGTRSDRG